MAEETVSARVASAWGIFLSVAVSAVVGFVFLLALTTHLPNLSTLFPATLDTPLQAGASQYYFGDGYAVISILQYNLDSIIIAGFGVGDLLLAGIAIAMAFCGLSSVASAGRMLYAFSRDDGIPGSGWLKKVSHRYRTPANSLTAMVVVAWLFSVAAFIVGTGVAVVIITAVSTIFLYAAYGICIYLGATTEDVAQGAGLEPWPMVQADRLGRPSSGSIVLMFLFSWPTSGNISLPFMVIIVLFLLVYYFAFARRNFQGPRVMGDAAELTEIEREFDHAAGEVGGTVSA